MYLGVSPNTKGFPKGEPFVFFIIDEFVGVGEEIKKPSICSAQLVFRF